jgi:hypothetical protein
MKPTSHSRLPLLLCGTTLLHLLFVLLTQSPTPTEQPTFPASKNPLARSLHTGRLSGAMVMLLKLLLAQD